LSATPQICRGRRTGSSTPRVAALSDLECAPATVRARALLYKELKADGAGRGAAAIRWPVGESRPFATRPNRGRGFSTSGSTAGPTGRASGRAGAAVDARMGLCRPPPRSGRSMPREATVTLPNRLFLAQVQSPGPRVPWASWQSGAEFLCNGPSACSSRKGVTTPNNRGTHGQPTEFLS